MKPDQISKTAAFLAIKFYGLTRIPAFRRLFKSSAITFYERIVQHLPRPMCYYHYWLKFDWIRSIYIGAEEFMLPGDLMHVIARKWYIRKLLETYKEKGYEQIIVLGAGFDDLSYSFTQKGLSCFEIDVPAMANQKRDFFNIYYGKAKTPDIIGFHLTDKTFHFPFGQSNIDFSKKTIIVAEGFFDYLKTDLTNKVLSQINKYFIFPPLLITTHFALNELPLLHRWSFKTGVQAVGEKLQLHKSIEEFHDLLIDHELIIQQQYDYKSMALNLQSKTGTSLSVLKGFYVLSAQQDQ